MKQITFWEAPTAARYERLIRDNVVHVGKSAGFKAIQDFLFTYAGGYTTLSHDNIDVLLSCQDNKLVIIEWPKHATNGIVNKEQRLEYTLSDYPLVRELAKHLESKLTRGKVEDQSHTHTPNQ
jgi:hypothetical protein